MRARTGRAPGSRRSAIRVMSSYAPASGAQFMKLEVLTDRGAELLNARTPSEAAMRLFSQHGVRRTSMDLIAQRAQVAKPTLYVSFKTSPAEQQRDL